MRKYFLILLLLIACVPAQKGLPKMPELRVGTSALEISFAPGSISTMMMCQEAEIIVHLKNIGAYNIVDGRYVWIFNDQILAPLSERSGSFSVEGRSEYSPSGGIEIASFGIRNLGLPENLESFDAPLSFVACYKYKTIANAPVCIDPDFGNPYKKKACTAQVVSLSGGQGGPVSVTKVEPLMDKKGDKVIPVFVVYLQHLGSGQVISEKGAELACGGLAGPYLAPEISVSASVVGTELSCSPVPIRIEPAKDTRVVCKYKEAAYAADAGAFTTVLSVTLGYGYMSGVDFPLRITRMPGQGPCVTVD